MPESTDVSNDDIVEHVAAIEGVRVTDDDCREVPISPGEMPGAFQGNISAGKLDGVGIQLFAPF